MTDTTFAERLREARVAKDMTQLELATALRVGQSAVSMWERGATMPTLENLIALAKILDVSMDSLLASTGDLLAAYTAMQRSAAAS